MGTLNVILKLTYAMKTKLFSFFLRGLLLFLLVRIIGRGLSRYMYSTIMFLPFLNWNYYDLNLNVVGLSNMNASIFANANVLNPKQS